jgi:uncharacterized protein
VYPLLNLCDSAYAFTSVATLGAFAAKLYDPALWRARWFQLCFAAFCGSVLSGLSMWWLGSPVLRYWGVSLVWAALPVASFAVAGAFAAGGLRRLGAAVTKWRGRSAKSQRAGARRAFLRRAAAVLPVGAGGAAAWAMVRDEQPRLLRIPLKYPNLPSELHGLRILQLSDLHLGAGPTSADLKALLDGLRADPPDLVVLTGDVADKLDELEIALQLVTELAPRFGVYAILGNHEYLNDIKSTLPVYQRSALKLLINQTARLRIGDATLHISGVDDPVFSGPEQPFYERVVAACAQDAVGPGFRLLLCHRPGGFEVAAKHGFDLTLSGHTHGSQLGLLGRSAVEVLFGVPYQWGLYRRGQSRLYTTSGFGQWFPFRLNCPPEAPLIVLERA